MNNTKSTKFNSYYFPSLIMWSINFISNSIGMENCSFNQPQFVKSSHLFCGGRITKDCYEESPLWDGEDCGSNVDCTLNDPPWFYTQLPELTSDDIEMRVCRDQPHDDEDIAIQAFKIYVQ